MPNDRITVNDARRAGFCARGVRQLCDQHGVSFKEFIKNGIPLEKVRNIDNAFVQAVVKLVEDK